MPYVHFRDKFVSQVLLNCPSSLLATLPDSISTHYVYRIPPAVVIIGLGHSLTGFGAALGALFLYDLLQSLSLGIITRVVPCGVFIRAAVKGMCEKSFLEVTEV